MLVKKTAVVLSGALTEALNLNVESYATLALQIKPAVRALTAFQVLGAFYPGQTPILFASIGTDYTSPTHPVKRASGDLTTLGAGSTGWVMLDVRHLHTIVLKATAANTDGTLDVHGIAN